jgi:hypothetical protein
LTTQVDVPPLHARPDDEAVVVLPDALPLGVLLDALPPDALPLGVLPDAWSPDALLVAVLLVALPPPTELSLDEELASPSLDVAPCPRPRRLHPLPAAEGAAPKGTTAPEWVLELEPGRSPRVARSRPSAPPQAVRPSVTPHATALGPRRTQPTIHAPIATSSPGPPKDGPSSYGLRGGARAELSGGVWRPSGAIGENFAHVRTSHD